jgi:hypothetical protein
MHRLVTPDGVRDPDGYVHMVIARDFRENKHKIPDTISNSLFDWKYIYPPILHHIISYIPDRYYELVDELFPTVMDLFYIGLLFILVPLNVVAVDEVIIIFILFITTPQFIQYSAGKGISARKPGILLGTVSLLSFFLWSMSGDIWALFVSSMFAGATHLTSRFGTQALLSVYIGFTFLYPISLLIIISSFVISSVFSKGHYIQIFRAHLRFSYDYAVRKQFVFLHNGFKSIDTFRRLVAAQDLSDILSAIYESVLLKMFMNNPYTIVALVFLFLGQQTSSFSVSPELIIWFGSSLFMSILTTSYGLRFLGQPGRYLNFSFIPTALIIVEAYHLLPVVYRLFLLSAVFVGLAMIGWQVVAYKRLGTSDEKKQQLNHAIEYINNNNICRIISQPRHLGSEIAWKAPDCSISDYFGDSSSQSGMSQSKDVFEQDPYVTSKVDLLEQFNPECVIFDKDAINQGFDSGVLLPPDAEPIFENKYYSIYTWNLYTIDN